MIYLISILYLIILLIVESLFGINWDYHPDSIYYIENSENIAAGLNYNNILNNFYYYVISIFRANILGLILLNSILYVITNSLIYKCYFEKNFYYSKFEKIIIILIILNPYRAHLALHVLKDTIVIFFFILAVVGPFKLKIVAFLILILTRVASIIYFIPLIIKKFNTFIRFFLILIIMLFAYESYNNGLLNLQPVDMRFREFDTVPTYMEQGFLGAILRFISWPLLLISGGFIFFMPSILTLPILLSSILIQIWSLYKFKKLYFYTPIILTMGFFAFLVTGYTSFIRYTLPLITLIPILFEPKK